MWRPNSRTSAAIALFGALALIGVIAWAQRRDMPLAASRALDGAADYELLSLNPDQLPSPSVSTELFHNRQVLGRTTIVDASIRRRLSEALRAAARQSDGRVMACFNPRHAIRVTTRGVSTDFLICFECRQVEVLRGDTQIAFFPISDSGPARFDEVLRKAGVPLAPAPQ